LREAAEMVGNVAVEDGVHEEVDILHWLTASQVDAKGTADILDALLLANVPR
jgi:hypothetical protein